MKKNFFVVCTMLLLSSYTHAQNSIKGTVTDNQGAPLPGVSIVVKGIAKGTTTVLDGDGDLVAGLLCASRF
jgi:hypothetical protein